MWTVARSQNFSSNDFIGNLKISKVCLVSCPDGLKKFPPFSILLPNQWKRKNRWPCMRRWKYPLEIPMFCNPKGMPVEVEFASFTFRKVTKFLHDDSCANLRQSWRKTKCNRLSMKFPCHMVCYPKYALLSWCSRWCEVKVCSEKCYGSKPCWTIHRNTP